MRILITGGGDVGRIVAETLVNAGHGVVLVEEEREVCERLAGELDLVVICGDATKPDILEKAEVEKADLVLALSGNDKMNLITALVAKTYEAPRVIVKLDDPDFNAVCHKLGVEEIINPKTATAKHISDMAKKPHALEVSTLVGGSIRAFTAIITKKEIFGKHIEELKWPENSLAVVVERKNEFFIPRAGLKLLEGDKVIAICEEKSLEELSGLFNNTGESAEGE